MEVVPPSVEAVARGWEEQQLDLEAAAGQLRGASTAGFTGPVAGAAARFTTSWERYAASLAAASEQRADGLHAALREYIVGDETQELGFLQLVGTLLEAAR
jgi:hypothetical protein